MLVVLMDNLYGGTSSCSESDCDSSQNWHKVQSNGRVCQRRQRNRDAARKNRKKQTERADVLHEEMQALEQSNAVIVKEIAKLQKEVQNYTTALKQHEPHCTLLSWHEPSLPVTGTTPSTSTSNLDQNYNLFPKDKPFFMTTQDTAAPELFLSELLDRVDWLPLDQVDI